MYAPQEGRCTKGLVDITGLSSDQIEAVLATDTPLGAVLRRNLEETAAGQRRIGMDEAAQSLRQTDAGPSSPQAAVYRRPRRAVASFQSAL